MTLQGRIALLIGSIGADIKTVLGRSLPAGGTTGQVLAKTSATDYAVSWQTVSSSSGGIAPPATSGTAVSIPASGSYAMYDHTTTGNTTFTVSSITAGQIVYLPVKIGTAGHTLTFSGVTWPGGTSPSLATAVNSVYVFGFIFSAGAIRCTGLTAY